MITGTMKKQPQQEVMGYDNPGSHLLDEFRRLNCLIEAQVLRLRSANFYSNPKDFRSFFIDDSEVDGLLSAGVFEPETSPPNERVSKAAEELLKKARHLKFEIEKRIRETYRSGNLLPLIELTDRLRLKDLEQEALIVCLAPQIDARYEKLYAYLQNDITKKSPSLDLIFNLLSSSTEERLQLRGYLSDASPLLQYRLLEEIDYPAPASAAQRFLKADSRVVQYVLGNSDPDRRLLPHLRFLLPLKWEDVIITEPLKLRLQNLLPPEGEEPQPSRRLFYFYGRPGVGKKTIARALCGEGRLELATIDLATTERQPEAFAEKMNLIFRETILHPCAVYFDSFQEIETEVAGFKALVNILAGYIEKSGIQTFIGSTNPLPDILADRLPVHEIEIPAPDTEAQLLLWKKLLPGKLPDKEKRLLQQLTAQFNLTGAQISRAVSQVTQAAAARDAGTEQFSPDDLMAACRNQSQPALHKLALKLKPLYTWKDIVLPEETLTQLRDICQRVRHRRKVYEEWGFRSKLSQGKGITALFAGPSGTGKTMAAEIIANELALDLYRIDLSGVVSKYIGETEKNLDRIFTAAEHANIILFFDEADALFGKRSEVRDSHDRYANIEISYLLQKMEQYEGIAILATNLRQNLDESFIRRLAFTVHFPFPDEASRLRIWKGIWPDELPISEEIDFNMLAKQFKLSGGNIKNIALAAAFLAADRDATVTMNLIIQAVQREYQKMGKNIREGEYKVANLE